MDDLKKLMAEATPGPWFVSGVRFKMNRSEWHGIMSYNEAKKQDDNVCLVGYDPRTGEGHADARLIVAAVNALPELLAMARRVEADAACYASTSAAAQNVIDGLMAENAKLKAALEPDMFWDQDNPEQPHYDIEELFREQDYDRDRDIIIDTQEAVRCEDGAYFCRINSPSEDSETDDAEVIIRKLTDDERKQWRAVYRVWLSMQYLKPLFARAALRSEP